MRWCWIGLILAGVGYALTRPGGHSLAQLEALARNDPGRLATAFAALVAHLLLAALAWRVLIGRATEATTAARIVALFLVTIPAKYVPGSIWQIAGRGHGLVELGCPPRRAAWLAVAEQLVAFGTCGALLLLLRLVLPQVPLPAVGATTTLEGLLTPAAALLVLGVLVVLAGSLWRSVAPLADGLRFGGAIAVNLASMACFLWAYVLVAGALLPLGGDAAWQLASFVMAGTVAGLVAIFAPGGIGVREASIVALAGGASAMPGLVLAVAVVRVLIIAAELLLAGMAAIAVLRWRR